MRFSFALVVASAVLSQCGSLVSRSVATITSDITAIGNQVTKLNGELKSFTGGFTTALAIDSDARKLVTLIDKGTTDVRANGQANAADTKTVLDQVSGIEPSIIDTLDQLIAKHDTFAMIGAAGIAKADNAKLANATAVFSSALVSIADASGKAQGQVIKDNIDAAFARSTKAYASD